MRGLMQIVQKWLFPPSAGFTFMLSRLKPRASKSRGPRANVYNIFDTVIGLFTRAVITHCRL